MIDHLPKQAYHALGKLTSNKECHLYNLPQAIKYFNHAADAGNVSSLYELGKIYLNKNNNIYDVNIGFTHMYNAAMYGNSFAMAKIGSIYLWGYDKIKPNIDLGKQWINKAIEADNPYAKDILAMYENYKNDIAIGVTFSLGRSLLQICNSQNKKENIAEIISKVKSKEALRDAQIKSERTL